MSCITAQNTGQNGLCHDPAGPIVGAWVSASPISITIANAKLEASIKALMVVSDMDERLIPLVYKTDPEVKQQREAKEVVAGNGEVTQLGIGNAQYLISVRSPNWYEVQKKLISGMNSGSFYAIMVTSNGTLIGNESTDGLSIEGKPVKVGKMLVDAEGYESEQMLQFTISETDAAGDLEKYLTVKPTAYNPSTLKGVSDVTVTEVSAAALEVVCTVTVKGNSDWNVTTLNTDGTNFTLGTGTVSSAAYSSTTGQWTLVTVGAATGALNVVPLAADSYMFEGSTTITV